MTAHNGIFDLTNWNIQENDIIELNGEWKYIIGDNYRDSDISFNEAHTINVPDYWNKIFSDGRGTIWYLLYVYLPEKFDEEIGIYIKYAFTCYELYINNERILSRGIVKDSKENIPQFLPAFSKINHNHKILKIAWKISNYHDAKGGAFYPVILGKYNKIQNIQNKKLIVETFQLFFVFVIFLFHLSLWLSRKKEIEYLIFSLCALSIFIRTAGTSNLFSLIINKPDLFIYIFEIKIIYLGGILALYLFPLFFEKYYKHSFSIIITKIFLCISIFFGFLLLITDVYFFTSINLLLQIIVISGAIWIIIYNMICMKQKIQGAKIFFVGMVIFFLTMVNDVLFSYIFLITSNILPFGFIAFIFSMSTVLIIKLTKSLKNEEYLTTNLKKEVAIRTFELEEANKQKTDLFINLAHETKTPLTLISNYLVKYLQQNEKNKDLLIIRQNIEKLKNDMVNFLDAEKLERNLIFYDNSQICDLSTIVLNKNILFKETASQKKIELKWNIKEGLYLKADPVAIDRILNNLLDNAVKYTEVNGSIYVSLIRSGDYLKLTIADTGVGISQDQKEHIFSPYYQLSHKKRNVQGLGMGLHITQKIVETLNGKIAVNSDPGKGSEFIITFHIYEKQTGDVIATAFDLTKPIDNVFIAPEELSVNEFDQGKNTIFIIEDNLQLVVNLKKELEEMYNVYFGTNGKEALEKLETLPTPDIIISDIMMDVMDGYEFREKLTKIDKYKAIPFVFITAKGKKDEKLRGLSQGAVDYICKPFELSELKEKIKNWLLLIELKGFNADIELKSKHQSRLDNFIKENDISPREKEVLSYLLQGSKNSIIAKKMFITPSTVKKHIERIKVRLNLSDKEELIKYLYDYVYK